MNTKNLLCILLNLACVTLNISSLKAKDIFSSCDCVILFI